MTAAKDSIESTLDETRRFEPSAAFAKEAHVDKERYDAIAERAERDPEGYWAEAADELVWRQKWSTVLEWDLPDAKWFVGGKLNVTDTCITQHLHNGRRNKAAIIFEGEAGDTRTLTYQQLHDEVCAFAGALAHNGVKTGDRVAIYMPMVPEAAVAMLACAHLGATHSVIFGGFSADAIRDRCNDATCSAIITADGGNRKGGVTELKSAVDQALDDDGCPSVKKVFVLRRTGNDVTMTEGRDLWWHDAVRDSPPLKEAVAVDAEHPLFILYTSGTTGKPKGVVHSTGGYLTQAKRTSHWVFDLKDDDVYWCSADVGWVTGHSYITYGPLANGATVLMYEGAPTYPAPDRFWELIERHHVTVFYTAPTAIRTFMRLGDDHIKKHDLSSLRLLGTVGEPINPEAWIWYHELIGNERCPIVDTWWQTETGAIMITPLPGAVTTKPGSGTRPFPGVSLDVVHEDGTPCGPNEGGYLVATRPWPSMMRGVWGDEERFRKTYWSQVKGCYFAGDGARKDEDGYFWVMGRIDDVVNVSGHRIGTMEVESSIVAHDATSEAAVVPCPDDVTGQALVAFVTLKQGIEATDVIEAELRARVAQDIGPFAKPKEIRFTDALPKTRSGKIMRRLLRELASEGKVTGDVTTLEDLDVIAQLRKAEE